MDDDQKELAKIGAEAAMWPFADLIDKLFGEPLGELGGMVKDNLAARRHIRRIGLIKKVQSAIEEAGFEPKRISDNIWVPAIQEATLQDDETLQEIWANLLANAADPQRKNPTSVSFVSMLKELTSREVKFLNALFESIEGTGNKKPLGVYSDKGGYTECQLLSVYGKTGLLRCPELASLPFKTNKEECADRIEADMYDFHQTIGVLVRNGIMTLENHAKPIKIQIKGPAALLAHIPDKVDIETEQVCNVTDLGWSFIRACRAPAPEV
jgi:hypothetical protein